MRRTLWHASVAVASVAGILASTSCLAVRPLGGPTGALPSLVRTMPAAPPLAVVPLRPTEAASVTPQPTATPVPPTATATPVVVGPDFPENVDPLTGLTEDDQFLLDRRPVAIKVSNFPRSLRPQSGLSGADLVFEYYTEEGMSRFLAVFLGQDVSSVGPVRSARYMDSELVMMYQAVLGFVGADPMVWAHVVGTLGSRAISESPSTCPALCRGGNGNVNSVFADTGAFTSLSQSQGRRELDGMTFETEPPPGGQPGDQVQVRFSWGTRAEWRYQESLGAYQRWSESLQGDNIVMVPLTDRDTGQQLQTENVAILYAEYSRLSGNEKYDVDFVYTKRGRLQLFRDGLMYSGFWEVANPTSPFQFVDASGAPLPLHPGNTWFEVVGEESASRPINPGQWEIDFSVP